MSNKKIDKNTIPEGFTIKLALVDAWPVIAFGASMFVLGKILSSALFMIGAGLCLFAGAAKVIWKIIVVLQRKNIWWLFMQMRIVMPFGMILMLLGLFINNSSMSGAMLWGAVTSVPAVIFFVTGIIGMLMMTVFAFVLDSSDVKSNWIEQCTNGIAQTAFFIGLLMIAL